MDNVKALSDAMAGVVFMDSASNDRLAHRIVANLYEAGFIIRPTSRAERRAVRTITQAMDSLPSDESRQKVAAGVLRGR